jgi:hypothetical protein
MREKRVPSWGGSNSEHFGIRRESATLIFSPSRAPREKSPRPSQAVRRARAAHRPGRDRDDRGLRVVAWGRRRRARPSARRRGRRWPRKRPQVLSSPHQGSRTSPRSERRSMVREPRFSPRDLRPHLCSIPVGVAPAPALASPGQRSSVFPVLRPASWTPYRKGQFPLGSPLLRLSPRQASGRLSFLYSVQRAGLRRGNGSSGASRRP